jgi:hypothetical protein
MSGECKKCGQHTIDCVCVNLIESSIACVELEKLLREVVSGKYSLSEIYAVFSMILAEVIREHPCPAEGINKFLELYYNA